MATLAFGGPSLLILTIYDGEFTGGGQFPVSGTVAFDVGNPDPTNAWGGTGTRNGIPVLLTGDRNINVPQHYMNYSQLDNTEYSALFDVTDIDTHLSDADDPANWTVEVNGINRTISNVFRKTIPWGSEVTSELVFSSVHRHTVSILLSSPLSIDDDIEVIPTVGSSITGVYNPDVYSPAINCSQLGFVQGNSQKVSIGLWLGQDDAGTDGTTDAQLSELLDFQVKNSADGSVAYSGNIGLVKDVAEEHLGGLNWNGCDIYEADFTAADLPIGDYYVSVEGVGSSVIFPVKENPYPGLLRSAARAFFFQRSGQAISSQNGEGFTWPRSAHPADGLTVWQTDIKLGRGAEGFTGSNDIFDELQAWPISIDIITTDGNPRTFADSLTNEARWTDVGGTPFASGTFNLSGGDLVVTGSGTRQTYLTLEEACVSGHQYRVRITLDSQTAGVDTQWEVYFSGSGSLSVFTSLSVGVNEAVITAAADYPRLSVDANSTCAGVIGAISVERITSITSTPAVSNPNAWGGWNDAADWDKRIQHMDTVYLMAQIIELFPKSRTLNCNIPESGKTFANSAVLAKKNALDIGDGVTILPDLIHEALWGISIFRRMQGTAEGTSGDDGPPMPEGAVPGGTEYSSSSIHGSKDFDPVQETYAYAEEEWASYGYACAAAKLGHVIKIVCGDSVLGNQLISEAVAAWTWAESVFATGIDADNGSDGDPATANIEIMKYRLRAAATLYRAAGTVDAKEVWEAYNNFSRIAITSLIDSGTAYGVNGDYDMQALDYWKAGIEGRVVNSTISAAIHTWCVGRFDADRAIEVGNGDYGLHNINFFSWGTGWFRFGPASNYAARRSALTTIADGGAIDPAILETVFEGLWFALGNNPAGFSLVQGVEALFFRDPTKKNSQPGLISPGPCAGTMASFSTSSITIYPKAQTEWPKYAAIFPSYRVTPSAESGVKAILMEWLFATAFANEGLPDVEFTGLNQIEEQDGVIQQDAWGTVFMTAPNPELNVTDFQAEVEIRFQDEVPSKVTITLKNLPGPRARLVFYGDIDREPVAGPILDSVTTRQEFDISILEGLHESSSVSVAIIPFNENPYVEGTPRIYTMRTSTVEVDPPYTVTQIPIFEPLIDGPDFWAGERIKEVTRAQWNINSNQVSTAFYANNDPEDPMWLMDVGQFSYMDPAIVPTGADEVVVYPGQTALDLEAIDGISAPIAFGDPITIKLPLGVPAAAPTGATSVAEWLQENVNYKLKFAFAGLNLNNYDAAEWTAVAPASQDPWEYEKGFISNGFIEIQSYQDEPWSFTSTRPNFRIRLRRKDDPGTWDNLTGNLTALTAPPVTVDPGSTQIPVKNFYLRTKTEVDAGTFSGPFGNYQRVTLVTDSSYVIGFGDTQLGCRRNPNNNLWEPMKMRGARNFNTLAATVDPSDHNHMIAIFHSHFIALDQTERWVMESFDMGDSWTLVGGTEAAHDAVFGVLRSTRCTIVPFENKWFAWSKSEPNVLYLHYQPVLINGGAEYNAAAASFGSSYIFKSTDFGRTWTLRGTYANTVFRCVRGLVVDPTNSAWLYIKCAAGLLWNQNSGSGAFSRFAGSPSKPCRSFYIKPDRTEMAAAFDASGSTAATQGGPFLSLAPFTNWVNKKPHSGTGTIGWVQMWVGDDFNKWWVGTGSNGTQLHVTAIQGGAGGTSWTLCKFTRPGYSWHTQIPGGRIGEVLQDKNNHAICYSQCQCFFKSVDGGVNFVIDERGMTKTAVNSSISNPRTGEMFTSYEDIGCLFIPPEGIATATMVQAQHPRNHPEYERVVGGGSTVSLRSNAFCWRVETGPNEGRIYYASGKSQGTHMLFYHPEPADELASREQNTAVPVLPERTSAVNGSGAGADPANPQIVYLGNDRLNGTSWLAMVRPSVLADPWILKSFVGHSIATGKCFGWCQIPNSRDWKLFMSLNGFTTGAATEILTTRRASTENRLPPFAASTINSNICFAMDTAYDILEINVSTGAKTSLGVRAAFIRLNGNQLPRNYTLSEFIVYDGDQLMVAVGWFDGSVSAIYSPNHGQDWFSLHNINAGEDQGTLSADVSPSVGSFTMTPASAANRYSLRGFGYLGWGTNHAEAVEFQRAAGSPVFNFTRRGIRQTSKAQHFAGDTFKEMAGRGFVPYVRMETAIFTIDGNVILFTHGNGIYIVKLQTTAAWYNLMPN